MNKKRSAAGAVAEAPSAEEELLTVVEVAKMLRLSRAKIYQMLEAGELAHERFGSARRILKSSVLEYREAARTPARR